MRRVRVRIVRREHTSRTFHLLLTVLSLIGAFLIAGILMVFLGVNPLAFYSIFLKSSILTTWGLQVTLSYLVPILLCCLSAIVSYRAALWNIGQEGQYIIGAMTALAVGAFVLPRVPPPLSYLLLILAGAAGGGVWALVCGLLRIVSEINEAVTTLLMYYVALQLLNYVCRVAWRNPAFVGHPETYSLAPQYMLSFSQSLIIAIVILAVTWFIIDRTRLGLELDLLSEGFKVAQYSGVKPRRVILWSMFFSGALAGISGALYLASTSGFLQPEFSVGYGFAGIIAAWLCDLKVLYAPLASFLLAMMYSSGHALQACLHVSIDIVDAIEGLILMAVLTVHFFTRYKIVLVRQ